MLLDISRGEFRSPERSGGTAQVARSGALYYLSNEFSFRVLDLLGPVPQAVANAAKRVFVLAVRGPRAETFRPSASLRGTFHVKAAAACPRQSVNRGRRPLDVGTRPQKTTTVSDDSCSI